MKITQNDFILEICLTLNNTNSSPLQNYLRTLQFYRTPQQKQNKHKSP